MSLAVDLTFDRNFEDFDFSAIFDPGLEPGKGPSATWLYGLAYRHASRERTGAFEFSDALYWTLKEGAFEAFKWSTVRDPPREDWLYGKLKQFCESCFTSNSSWVTGGHPVTKEP